MLKSELGSSRGLGIAESGVDTPDGMGPDERLASAVNASITGLVNPSSYSGLYGFHKYWGKKPVEPLRFLISALTDKDDLVVDPFLGSGAVANEAARLQRRFVGGDVNPTAVRLTKFFVEHCRAAEYASAVAELERAVRKDIDATYDVAPFGVASHLLWRGPELLNVWQREPGKRSRKTRSPTADDLELAASFAPYLPTNLRPLRLFQNGRINSIAGMDWQTLFSGRALRNIELLRNRIRTFPDSIREALELTLTAAVGQMSKMVFAITSRGKTKGGTGERIEVGSWVIGYWRPQTHFEINVWNCFESKAKKVQKALLDEAPSAHALLSLDQIVRGESGVCIEKNDALSLVESLPPASVKLLITDPPHGDRIPYLELSEMWNAILGEDSSYEREVVVSDAKGRNKTAERYSADLEEFFLTAIDRIENGGFLVLLFNSRKDDDWSAIRGITNNAHMNLLGCFPMEYSATSVVQDNREGGMKNDYILVYKKGNSAAGAFLALKSIPGWRSGWPE